MDIQPPTTAIDPQVHAPADSPAPNLPRSVLNCHLRLLLAALPTEGVASEMVALNAEAAQAMFFEMQPRTGLEAAAAARAIAAMDLCARAARPVRRTTWRYASAPAPVPARALPIPRSGRRASPSGQPSPPRRSRRSRPRRHCRCPSNRSGSMRATASAAPFPTGTSHG